VTKYEGAYGIIVHTDEILPWAWSLQRVGPCSFRIIAPPDPAGTTRAERELGVIVPLAGHLLIGTDAERRAYEELATWRSWPGVLARTVALARWRMMDDASL
jgi:hypothetical protein